MLLGKGNTSEVGTIVKVGESFRVKLLKIR